jgi:formamidopyrimidine-DNA glycosylase
MPELPEVETTARGLRGRILGKRIVGAGAMDWPRMLPNATPELVEAAVRGRTVELVDRRGKYLILGLSDDRWVLIHRKMSGNLVVQDAGSPGPVRHTHLVVRFDDGMELHFVDPRKFGRIYLFTGRSELDRFLAERLGPEPLADLTEARLRALLQRRRGRLKSLLLDQRFLAGIGNLYADEILWEARLHPERSAASLTPRERGRLLQAIRRVLGDAIERRGTSFSTYVDAAGASGDNQDYLRVYGRAGFPCPRCGRPIERRVIAQRGTWLCPRCQKLSAER